MVRRLGIPFFELMMLVSFVVGVLVAMFYLLVGSAS
jgi:hypothetical protein